MFTVGKVAKMFNLSRTTLLYYDDIGVFRPSQRGENGYRLYSEGDVEKLRQIVSLREAGIPLVEVSKYLETTETEAFSILIKMLGELNKEIENIKRQQDVIVKLLISNDLKEKRASMTQQLWLSILKKAGIHPDTAYDWHANFEKLAPDQHHSFLLALGFTHDEIAEFKKSKDPLGIRV